MGIYERLEFLQCLSLLLQFKSLVSLLLPPQFHRTSSQLYNHNTFTTSQLHNNFYSLFLSHSTSYHFHHAPPAKLTPLHTSQLPNLPITTSSENINVKMPSQRLSFYTFANPAMDLEQVNQDLVSYQLSRARSISVATSISELITPPPSQRG